MKNSTIAVITIIFVCALVVVVVYDQQTLSGDETLGVAELNRAREGEGLLSESSSQNREGSTTNRIAWATEVGSPQQRINSKPKPYKKGVVELGSGASLGGKLIFPKENAWNQRIDNAPVDPMSRRLIAGIGITKNLHPDFGAGKWEGARMGIPYVVVSGDQPKVPIVYQAYGDQSDPGPYPIPVGAPIEGHPNEDGDRHVIVIDRDNWKLYETFRSFSIGNGQLWRADSGAIFDLAKAPSRPVGWTSADAAGLPIFPGLVRYDEVGEMKEIRHALRFTVNNTRRAFIPPASHWASRSSDPRLPPLGMRVRLKKDYDISGFPPQAKVILVALKRYGMILADNGSDWFISGAPDDRWDDDDLRSIKKVLGKDLEVVLMQGMVAD